MERLEGYSIAKKARMVADGVDLRAFAQLFANVMLDMIFKHGFYHADPHPGNIFVLPGGKLGLLDCGKTGRVDEQTQDDFIRIVTAFLGHDVAGLTDELINLCDTPPDLNRSAYQADVAEFIGEFAETPDGKLNLGAAFEAMFALIRKYHLVVPPRVNMLLLVIVQTEGTARDLDPDFNLADALKRYGAGLMQRRFTAQAVAARPSPLFPRLEPAVGGRAAGDAGAHRTHPAGRAPDQRPAAGHPGTSEPAGLWHPGGCFAAQFIAAVGPGGAAAPLWHLLFRLSRRSGRGGPGPFICSF